MIASDNTRIKETKRLTSETLEIENINKDID